MRGDSLRELEKILFDNDGPKIVGNCRKPLMSSIVTSQSPEYFFNVRVHLQDSSRVPHHSHFVIVLQKKKNKVLIMNKETIEFISVFFLMS